MNPNVVVSNPQMIMGLVPCLNQFFMNAVTPTVMPGLKELADGAAGEFTAYQILTDIYFGLKQLHLGYVDRAGAVKQDDYQEWFAKKLATPAEDFVGFTIVQPLREDGFHIFAAYIKPEYRHTNMFQLGLAYLEGEARKMGAPYLSLSTRHDVAGALSQFGFVETTANFRKRLKE